MSRLITSHIVNPVNDRIEINVLDEPGAGGAHHAYGVVIKPERAPHYVEQIKFQNGPIAEADVNGLTQEVLLAICADRLECFQKGPYACRENAIALTKIQEAMMWLQRRTLERMRRGVEGTMAK